MELSSLIVSAVSLFAGSMFVLIGGAYIAYRIKRKS
jgi:hypothetical protein